ncbi:hypothetical protein GPEL0_01r2058 [Geoanaerobacter pelophilus]|uniref:Uncharacterized protein n=1 Tax=Geoanaerobacter pelophilus TaxID=60036 RepID=A0ABQ0MHP6_9BACT|nr:hypothetical protein GPEL0_01r2058 [Geoanaerobacter pelophilus]
MCLSLLDFGVSDIFFPRSPKSLCRLKRAAGNYQNPSAF